MFAAARYSLFCLVLLFGGTLSRGGITSYTDRGKVDFDTVLQILNPYGTWSKIDDAWAYTPLDRQAPYTHGRWLYTEYGWYWKGDLPHSWVTEHYGYWKRGADKVWSWYPGPVWLPEIVEMRATSTHIGWRSGAVDRDGNYLEEPEDRYAKPDEWTFVTLAQFGAPITPGLIAKPEEAKSLLEDSTESRHTYLTYRRIDRPGPHPADFLALCKDGGMFAPRTAEDEMAVTSPHPKPAPDGKATNSPASVMTGTNAPTLLGADPDPGVDARQVKYWVTMSLPTYWTPPPSDGKLGEIYLYRPDIYQDEDGIARRITLWFNPQTRISLKEALAGARLPQGKPDAEANGAPAIPATPATPVVPAASDSPTTNNPFRSPFDDAFRPGASGSSKKVLPSQPTDAPATNAAPTDRP